MDPLTLMAIATLVSTGFAVESQNRQVRAQNRATRDANRQMVEEQNKLVKEAARKRMGDGTILGGSPEAQAASEQGSILTSSNSKRSLLG